jgi:hypothetical protein
MQSQLRRSLTLDPLDAAEVCSGFGLLQCISPGVPTRPTSTSGVSLLPLPLLGKKNAGVTSSTSAICASLAHVSLFRPEADR